MSFGLVLSGGGSKGAAHVGVLMALEENHIYPNSIAGTSAGAIVAGLYAAGISSLELRDIVITLAKKSFYMIDPSIKDLLKSILQFLIHKDISLSGFMKGEKMEEYFNKLTQNKNISDLAMRVVIPCVDLISGATIAYTNKLIGLSSVNNVVWENDIKLSAAMRASASLPAIIEPKLIQNMCLVDGGVTDVLPVDLLIAAGEPNIIAIDITEEYEMPGSYNIIEIAAHSLRVMRDCLCKYETPNEKLLIKPNLPKAAGLFTFSQMVDCMEAGYTATKELMPEILKVISS
jgi:NTE family protein